MPCRCRFSGHSAASSSPGGHLQIRPTHLHSPPQTTGHRNFDPPLMGVAHGSDVRYGLAGVTHSSAPGHHRPWSIIRAGAYTNMLLQLKGSGGHLFRLQFRTPVWPTLRSLSPALGLASVGTLVGNKIFYLQDFRWTTNLSRRYTTVVLRKIPKRRPVLPKKPWFPFWGSPVSAIPANRSPN